ncbi:MAG: LytTR family DNA-binding domain-containing protein [Muribaculaceae bacterium]|nr:LytTR family DNA-binding domain-containing protein [Muribaculaceae bacterium]
MKLRTLIIDDEPIALEKLRSYVEKTPFLELAGACGNGFEGLEVLSAEKVDLIITDIDMPDLNGMDLVKTLQNPPMVIFITAYDSYAVDSYRLSAVDYLLKPYSFVDFQKAAGKAREIYISRNPDVTPLQPESIFIKVDYRYIRVRLADITYIKGYGEYLQIYLIGKNTPLVTLSSFSAIKEKLSDSFLQVHRSYIVNMDNAEMIERNRIILDNDTYIPVGDSYKTPFQHYLATHSPSK